MLEVLYVLIDDNDDDNGNIRNFYFYMVALNQCQVLAHEDHLAMFGNIFSCHNWHLVRED